MSQQDTREVCVLTPFKDRDGTKHERGEVFAAAYSTPRQRQAVNQMVHRGFLTFDVEQAKKYLAKEGEKDKSRGSKE